MQLVGRTSVDVNTLLELARDKTVKGRTALAGAVSDMMLGGNRVLNERERSLMSDILNQLIHDVEMDVRRALSERLAENPNAPQELIITLANDEIEVARPILIGSQVIGDADLIEIIRHSTYEHQLTIAMRQELSKKVCSALVKTDNEDAITAMIENKTAKIGDDTMQRLVEKSKRIERYQAPLLSRPDLGEALARRMYWWVSAALRDHILDNFDINPTELDDEIESVVVEELEKDSISDKVRKKQLNLARKMVGEDSVTPKTLIKVLRQGDVALFQLLLAEMTKLRLRLIQRILFEPGGEGLCLICKASEVDKADFASIFLLSRKAHPSGEPVDPRELSNVLSLFDKIDTEAAKDVVSRMKRDPDYLNSIRLVANRSDEPAADKAAKKDS